ncbi:MAG: hypothetical protein SAL07_25650 [Oscillatoria sp. PMC 1051.18]|nr:hypothetical protein [Oscillatoria sp. PMC 1051.18]
MSKAKAYGAKSLRLVRATKLPTSANQNKVKSCNFTRTGGHLKNLKKNLLLNQNLSLPREEQLRNSNYSYLQWQNPSGTLFSKRLNFQANGRSTSSESNFYCKQS